MFQGRFKAILVDADSYLLELTRYVVLNPVRAGIVKRAQDWKWSSYQATVGQVESPQWLEVDGLLAQFGSRRSRAVEAYQRFVREGVGSDSIWQKLNRQVFLGSDAFVARALEHAAKQSDDINIPRAQRRPLAPTLAVIAKTYPHRDSAMQAAWNTGQYSYTRIASHFGVHFTTVGRAVRRGGK